MKVEIAALGDGRWALYVDGLARFVGRSPQECEDRARAIVPGPSAGTDPKAIARALSRAIGH